jgi:hypothetical protein
MSITRLQQARQMYALGQLVSKTMDGSRPGYRGDDAYGGGDSVAGGGDQGFGGDGPPGPDDRSTAQQTANQRAQVRAGNVRAIENLIDRPNLVNQIGTGIKNYIKGGGMLGMVGRGLGSLFDSFTGPKASEVGNLNMPGYNMLNIAGPVSRPPAREGGDGENRNLYATTNQYTIPTDVEEEGITTLVNNPNFIQRFRVKNPYRQDKQGELDPQIMEMINNLYT